MFFLVYFGAGMLIKAAPAVLEDATSGPLHYFNSTAEKVVNFASDWSSGERKPLDNLPLDLTPFRTVHEKAMGIVNMSRDYYFKYVDMASIATYCISSIGIVLCFLIIPFACCHCCIPWLPLVLSCLYWITGIIFAALGVVVTLLAYASSVTCGELELQYQRQPGFIQWYGIPFCQEKFNFTKINLDIREKELELSQKACTELLKVCENSNATNIAAATTPKRSKLRAPTPQLLKDLQALAAASGGAGGADLAAAAAAAGLGGGGAGAGVDTQNIADILQAANSAGGSAQGGAAGGVASLSTAQLSGLAGGSKNVFQGLPPGIKVPAGVDLSNLPKNPEEIAKMFPDLKNLVENVSSLSDILGKLSHPFLCGRQITKPEDCRSFGVMANVLADTKVKSTHGGCGNGLSFCTLSECAASCAIDFLRTTSAQILVKAELARNASIALSYARPLLECNFIVEKIAGALNQCSTLKTGTLMVGLGFFVGGLMFGLAIYITFRGACIWGDQNFQLRKKSSVF